MAPNTGSVCVDETRAHHPSSLNKLESFEMNPSTNGLKREKAIIFFDWDDTLLASSCIAKMGLCPKYTHEKPDIPADVARDLKELEETVVQLLDKALAVGRVIIVTAAETGWVELSASLYLPRVVSYLNTRVKVVSARSTYEYLYPDCPRKWKIEAFYREVFPVWEVFDSSSSCCPPRHVISLGDGPTEREALINVKLQARANCHGKSMKLIAAPAILELKMELDLVVENFDYLCCHEGDLDLQISWDMLEANGNGSTDGESEMEPEEEGDCLDD